MDKNTIIGFILIAAIVIGFSVLSKPSEEQLPQQVQLNDSTKNERVAEAEKQINADDSAQKIQPKEANAVNNFFETADATQSDSIGTSVNNEEKILSLENELIKIDFSTKGAQMISAQVKDYKTYQDSSLYLFNKDAYFSLELENKSSVRLNTREANFTPIADNDPSKLTFRLNYSDTQYVDFIYVISPNSYMVKFDIMAVGMEDILSRSSREKFILTWQQDLKRKEKGLKKEQEYSHIYYKNQGLDVNDLGNKDAKEEISNPVKWVAFKDQFFAAAIIADKSFDISVLDSKILTSEEYLKKYSASLYITPDSKEKGTLHTGFQFFLGPLKYSMLKGFDDGVKEDINQLDLDKLIPLGWSVFRLINQYFIIPLFNLLSKMNISMGLIILIMTIIVKLIISPLTFKSFMSSAKMRVLKPQVEEIGEKYPKQEQAMEKQRATMELYRQAGVNPMSGCIPMLLQMPILLALFAFFPSAIELRGESFLWAKDLSTYDAIFEWKTNIPFLSNWLGNHISLFCILMTATNIVYAKFNMDATNTGQQQMPGMKWMMYLMPLMFLFILNNYPAGLTYYYFISTLITILLTLAFRWFVNEDVLLAKLEENKKKPKKKKSGFMARLEEAQKIQQQQAKTNAKKKK